jgi:pyridoxamine 5'-phosphate oxidase
MAARLEQLAEIEGAVWRELAVAATSPDHEWRVGVLATSTGSQADARCVVLRDIDLTTRALVFYTDSRSPKVAHIETHPQGTLVLWSARLEWQLRLRVTLSIETAGLAVSSRWARLKMTPAAHDYLSPLPPGSPLERPLPARGTREFFAVATATVTAVDWLELHAQGQRRALFDEQGGRWLAP